MTRNDLKEGKKGSENTYWRPIDSEGKITVRPHWEVVAIQSQEHVVKQEAPAK